MNGVNADAGPHRAPHDCPVCGDALATTRLGCPTCGTELSGHFATCEFCALDTDDRDVLRVFLASRGNIKEVERHLGVSYPTARARVDRVITRLGLAESDPPDVRGDGGDGGTDPRREVLDALARGEIAPGAARDLLDALGGR